MSPVASRLATLRMAIREEMKLGREALLFSEGDALGGTLGA